MAPKITMQIARHEYHPVFQTYMNNPHAVSSRVAVPATHQTAMLRTANQARSIGGLDNMGMINRVRFAKAGCSSCGGGH
jgi:hypothetical protein